MTNEELDALDALCAAATPGPWCADAIELNDHEGHAAIGPAARTNCGDECEYVGCFDACECYENDEAAAWHDARFIATAREALPKLVAEVRRLRDECAEQGQELIRLHHWQERAPVDVSAVLAKIDAVVPESDPAYVGDVLEQRRQERDALMYAAADACAQVTRQLVSARAWSRRWKACAGSLRIGARWWRDRMDAAHDHLRRVARERDAMRAVVDAADQVDTCWQDRLLPWGDPEALRALRAALTKLDEVTRGRE